MFKRFTVILLTLFLLSILLLVFTWRVHPGVELYSETPVLKVYRISQDLGGKWNKYSSLTQAWAREKRLNQSDGNLTGLTQIDSIILPSGQGFSIIAKQFEVTGNWSSRSAQLVLSGVYGKAEVYLNGIDQVNFLGEITGTGGTYKLDIAPTRFEFGRENTLFIEISPGSLGKEQLFSWFWPGQGRITGQIRLEAVPESTVDLAGTSFSYDNSKEQLIVKTVVNHHQTLDKEPWIIKGVITKNEQKVAECLLPLSTNGMYSQTVELVFNLPGADFWSMENPHLYELQLAAVNSRGDMDSVQVPLGIRKFSADHGKWKINGQELPVQGIILFRDEEYRIRNLREIDNWLSALKEEGINLIYFMGYFPDEVWFYAADRLGMGVWLELPVNMVPEEKLPDPELYEGLLAYSWRHPSILAWTPAKCLAPSVQAEDFFKEIKERVPFLPVFHLSYKPAEKHEGMENILLSAEGFQGDWGRVDLVEDHGLKANSGSYGWKGQKAAVIVWFVWLVFISIRNWRSARWKYEELFSSRPKRPVREAFFWGCLALVSRMGTLAGLLIFLLLGFNIRIPYWLSYELGWISLLQNQEPFILWFFLTMSLITFRLIRVGVGASLFPGKPSSLGLTCWLEQKYQWLILPGAVWVMTVIYGLPAYLPLAVYVVLDLIFIPVRIRGVWKAKGSYLVLGLVPATAAAGFLAALIWHREDLIYVWKMVLPSLGSFMAELLQGYFHT